MRFDLNLATHPYEDSRRFYSQWVPALVLLAALAIGLSWFAYSQYAEYRRQNRELSELQSQIREWEKVKAEATEVLGRPDNSGTRDQAAYLNDLFRRKAFSWTQVMADLEKIMPAQVQVASIKPTLTPEGALEFSLIVNTRRRDQAIELVRRMEGSPRFVFPDIRAERAQTEGKSGQAEYSFEISALYRPATLKAVN
ncbi:MAG: PilN domain-containing protein [Terriglobales bacterium]